MSHDGDSIRSWGSVALRAPHRHRPVVSEDAGTGGASSRAREVAPSQATGPAGTSQVPDEVLVRQASLGEKEAFAQLTRRHGPALYRYVVRLLDDPSDAQDCAQEALFAAWRAIASFRGVSSFRTWLLVLGRHQAQKMSQRRRPPFPQSGSRAPIDFDQVTEHLRDLRVGPEGDTVESGLLIALDAALLQLPRRQRSVWILREIEDLSYAEIAEVTDIAPTSVRGLLQRARTAIAANMEDWR